MRFMAQSSFPCKRVRIHLPLKRKERRNFEAEMMENVEIKGRGNVVEAPISQSRKQGYLPRTHVGEERTLRGETQGYGHCISGQETRQNSIQGFAERI